ncbi:polysaccharide biosynthesis family protein, partial [Morganella morganii]|nr:polysaccharide biosynthesis family protein [Morganella morganii]
MDKIVIAQFNGASSLGPYYLANAFCMLPLSVLATPIMQYFQPKIIFDMNSGNSDVGHLKTFTITLILFTLTPSIIILLNIDTIINLWLNNDDSTISIVVTYIKILLPGVFFGAIGFIPYNLLIAIKDFKFQAICGTVLTFLTLSLT